MKSGKGTVPLSLRENWDSPRVCVAWCVVAFTAVLADPSPDSSVVAGRKALDRWGGYPWYDAKADSVRRIDVAPPRDPTETDQEVSSWASARWLEAPAWIALALLLGGLAYLLVQAYLRAEWPAETAAEQVHEAAEGQRRLEALSGPGALGDLLAQAERCYREGRYRQAIVYLFGHQLVELDKRRLVRLAKGKTNRQYLRELGARAGLRELIEQTMIVFEEAFFGNREIGRARFEVCWSRLAEFQGLMAEASA